jgi:hypothetical protein
MEASTKPEIFAFSLDEDIIPEFLLQSVYGHLMDAIKAKSNLKYAKTTQEALALFNQNGSPKGVFLTDPGIIESKNNAVSQKLTEYVRSGGNVVMGGLFSSFVNLDEMGTYMREKWNLPWEPASYHRTTLSLNQAVVMRPTSSLPSSYSQKAVSLKNVDPGMAWYVATDDSVVESIVPLPGPGVQPLETPVAFAKLGNGWVGYVGDVNAEKGTTAVILTMLDLTA